MTLREWADAHHGVFVPVRDGEEPAPPDGSVAVRLAADPTHPEWPSLFGLADYFVASVCGATVVLRPRPRDTP